MDKRIKKEYFLLRSKGWKAIHALRDARIKIKFEDLEADGMVRIVAEPDEAYTWAGHGGDCYNVDLLADTVPGGARTILAWKKAEMERVERDGFTYVKTEVQCPCCGSWEFVDGIGGFVGDDWKDSGYDTDLMATAIERARGPDGCLD
jgi:hypothetical protein